MHDTTFGVLDTCPACRPADPVQVGTAPEFAPAPAVVPEGCVTTLEHERAFTVMAAKCEEMADVIHQRGDNATAVVKLIDAAIKARRAASAHAKAREDDAFVADLERQRASMGRSNRGRH